MDFRTCFKANGVDYELVIPVPLTEQNHSVCIVRKDNQEELLRVNANHIYELPAIAEEANKLLPAIDQELFKKNN